MRVWVVHCAHKLRLLDPPPLRFKGAKQAWGRRRHGYLRIPGAKGPMRLSRARGRETRTEKAYNSPAAGAASPRRIFPKSSVRLIRRFS